MTFISTAAGCTHRSYAARLAASFRAWNWPPLLIVADGPVADCDPIIVQGLHAQGRDLKIRFAHHIPVVHGPLYFIDADCEAIGPYIAAPIPQPGEIAGIIHLTYNTHPKTHLICSATIGYPDHASALSFGNEWWHHYQLMQLVSDEPALYRVAKNHNILPLGTTGTPLPNLTHHLITSGKINEWNDLPGWCDFADLYESAAAAAPHGATMVEIGVWRGRSLAFLARAGQSKNLRCIGYDPFDPTYYLGPPIPGLSSHEWHQLVQADMTRLNPASPPEVIRADSLAAARRHADGSVYFVFLDGDHTYDQLTADIRAWLPKIAPGGILAGHDLDHPKHPGVRQALETSGLPWCKTSRHSWIITPTKPTPPLLRDITA